MGDVFQSSKRNVACAMQVLRASDASTVRRMCRGAAPDRHGHPPGVEMELLVTAHCAAGRIV